MCAVCRSLSVGWGAQPQSLVLVLLGEPKPGKTECNWGHSARALLPFPDVQMFVALKNRQSPSLLSGFSFESHHRGLEATLTTL